MDQNHLAPEELTENTARRIIPSRYILAVCTFWNFLIGPFSFIRIGNLLGVTISDTSTYKVKWIIVFSAILSGFVMLAPHLILRKQRHYFFQYPLLLPLSFLIPFFLFYSWRIEGSFISVIDIFVYLSNTFVGGMCVYFVLFFLYFAAKKALYKGSMLRRLFNPILGIRLLADLIVFSVGITAFQWLFNRLFYDGSVWEGFLLDGALRNSVSVYIVLTMAASMLILHFLEEHFLRRSKKLQQYTCPLQLPLLLAINAGLAAVLEMHRIRYPTFCSLIYYLVIVALFIVRRKEYLDEARALAEELQPYLSSSKQPPLT